MITICTELSCDLQGCRKVIGYAQRGAKTAADAKEIFKVSMERVVNNEG